MDGLIHCQVKQICIFSLYKKHFYETLQIKETIGEKLKMSFSNNTGGRSHTVKDILSESRGNETHSYGCLCSIPSSLISLEAIVCVLHRKKSRVHQAKQGNAVSHKTYVPCVVDWQITSSVLDNMLVMSSYCRKTQSVPRKSPHQISSGFSIVTMICGSFLRSYLIYENT